MIYGQRSVLKECCRYYNKLYSSQNIDVEKIKHYLSNTASAVKLSESEKSICDKDISEGEVLQAILALKCNKSPGIDGLIPELYQQY